MCNEICSLDSLASLLVNDLLNASWHCLIQYEIHSIPFIFTVKLRFPPAHISVPSIPINGACFNNRNYILTLNSSIERLVQKWTEYSTDRKLVSSAVGKGACRLNSTILVSLSSMLSFQLRNWNMSANNLLQAGAMSVDELLNINALLIWLGM